MKMVAESNKALPISFTLGLMAGIVATLGASGGTPSLLDWMIRKRFPRFYEHLPAMTERATYNPLYPYYRSTYGTLAPVDHAYLALLRQSLEEMYGERGGKGIALRIGQHWWRGEPPIHQFRPIKDTLQYMLTPNMLDVIHNARITYISRIRPMEPGKPTHPLPPSEPFMLIAACQAFADVFRQQSTMECQVETTNESICIRFPSCPFCNNHLSACNILRGVVEEMILWLYRKDTLASLNTSLRDYSLTMTPKKNDSHQMLIKLIQKR
jgi:hypothetical protein